jgi:hypothetical protein
MLAKSDCCPPRGKSMRAALALLVVFLPALCSCSGIPDAPPSNAPLAHSIASDGQAVSGAPEPEVVQLGKIEDVQQQRNVTVGNAAGDYVLVCSPVAYDNSAVPSCISPRPGRNYLLFRENTLWLRNGEKDPITLQSVQRLAVNYNHLRNVALVAAQQTDGEPPGVYWISSWKAKSSH